MSKITLEVCVDSVESALAAVQGGANRLELCSALSEGGLTPTLGLYRVVKSLVLNIPVFVMLRPRSGFDFVFSPAEKDIMRFDCRQFVEHGADGFVIGALTAEQEIDVAFARELIDIIGARPVTFHRAFDVVRDPVTALRQLIELGVGRVLTSGQKRSVVDGLPLLEQLHLISAGRINLMPGSGVNKSNVEHILPTLPGVTDVHLSGKQSIQPNFKQETEVCKGDSRDVTNTAVIREVRDIINGLEKKLRGENM